MDWAFPPPRSSNLVSNGENIILVSNLKIAPWIPQLFRLSWSLPPSGRQRFLFLVSGLSIPPREAILSPKFPAHRHHRREGLRKGNEREEVGGRRQPSARRRFSQSSGAMLALGATPVGGHSGRRHRTQRIYLICSRAPRGRRWVWSLNLLVSVLSLLSDLGLEKLREVSGVWDDGEQASAGLWSQAGHIGGFGRCPGLPPLSPFVVFQSWPHPPQVKFPNLAMTRSGRDCMFNLRNSLSLPLSLSGVKKSLLLLEMKLHVNL